MKSACTTREIHGERVESRRENMEKKQKEDKIRKSPETEDIRGGSNI